MTLPIPKFLCALIICTCAATTTLAQQLSAPDPEPGTIVGTVFDFTGGVVPGATVRLEGQKQNDERRVLTQDNGFFRLNGGRPVIHYRVTVSS